jgi:pimeloyl-ACP methyl ester carboxylesterase
MIPRPGETAGEWWSNTGWHDARREAAARDGRTVTDEIDPVAEFLHDVDPEVVAASADHVRAQAAAVFKDPWPLDAWPDVATRVIACRDDRFFPLELVQRVARDRLGIEPEQIPGGHLPALAHPNELVAVIAARGPAPLP